MEEELQGEQDLETSFHAMPLQIQEEVVEELLGPIVLELMEQEDQV